MNTILSLKSTPVYTIENLTQYPLNPYREFVHYCATDVFSHLEHKVNMSLKDFKDLPKDKQKETLETIIGQFENVEIKYKPSTSHQRIFLEAEIFHKDIKIALVQFFTHMTYIDTSNQSELDEEYVACELNLTDFDGFDFMNLSRNDNILDFSKDDTDKDTLDMFAAHIYGVINFTEFVKVYKAKSLIIKNIDLFTAKLIKPYVSDIQNAYSPEHFLIGVLCGENIHKKTYPYDGYLEHIKEFAAAIKDKYGEKFKVENDQKANETNQG